MKETWKDKLCNKYGIKVIWIDTAIELLVCSVVIAVVVLLVDYVVPAI